MEEWSPSCLTGDIKKPKGVPGRIISCFNASAVLCMSSRSIFPFSVFPILTFYTAGILSKIVQAIYAVHTISNRQVESGVLEGLLDKWYIELPEQLRYELGATGRYEPGATKRPVPPPHILTLHMQYWCAVLLLHRPL